MNISSIAFLCVFAVIFVSCSEDSMSSRRTKLSKAKTSDDGSHSGDVVSDGSEGGDRDLPSSKKIPKVEDKEGDPEADKGEEPGTDPGLSLEAGDCSKAVYPKTGRDIKLPGKFSTRNYASGAPSEVTWESEKNVDDSWKDYELTAYFKMGSGDDNAVWKMYGGNHSDGNKGWYVYGIDNDGKAVCGGEDEHPSKNPKWKCSGGDKTEFGRINDKVVGLKSVIWTDKNGDVTIQTYFDDGSGKWTKMASQTNPEGRKFKPQDPQNLLLRADGFEDLKVDCATAQEIVAPGATPKE
jgi:hypothetical protein